MSRESMGMLAVIVCYLIFLVCVGASFARRAKSQSEFYLGGRTLGPFVTAMSAEASDMSSWLLMGLPGVAYLSGVADAAWTAIGLALGTYFNWLFVSKRIRRYTEKTDSNTLPEYFSKRFGDKKNTLRAIGALVIVVFFVPYVGSGFSACGKLFGTLFGAPYRPTMIICAILIVTYTTLGGFLAASTNDFIQSVVMTIAILIVIAFGISAAGGWGAVMANANTMAGYISLTKLYDVATGTSSDYSLLTIISTLSWGLGYFGMPHILLRFMGTKDEKNLDLSRKVATIWVVISMAMAIAIGIVGNAVSVAGGIDLLTSSDSERVIIKLAMLLGTNGIVAIFFGGVILAGILACTMSTSDSQLLAAASSVSMDLVQGFFGVKMDKKKEMLIARATVVTLSLVAIVIAWDQNSTVFGIVSFAWAGFGAAFGPLVLVSLFWKRTNIQGALAGIIAGAIAVFAWKFGVRPMGGVWDLYELGPAFLVSLIAIVVVSLATAAPSREIVAEFEEVERGGR